MQWRGALLAQSDPRGQLDSQIFVYFFATLYTTLIGTLPYYWYYFALLVLFVTPLLNTEPWRTLSSEAPPAEGLSRGQLDSQIFSRSPASTLPRPNKPFLAPKRLKPAFFINRQTLPTNTVVMQANMTLLVILQHFYAIEICMWLPPFSHNHDLPHLCIIILIPTIHIITVLIITSLVITMLSISSNRSRAEMLSWPALYRPLILATFIPTTPKQEP